MAELEVYINTEINYQLNRQQQGQLKTLLVEDQIEQYMDGTFKGLINYVISSVGNHTDDQKNTMKGIKDLVNQDNSTNRVCVALYDKENNRILGNEINGGPIYLEDVVGDKVSSDAEDVFMTLETQLVVG